jgi:hypothetical protein
MHMETANSPLRRNDPFSKTTVRIRCLTAAAEILTAPTSLLLCASGEQARRARESRTSQLASSGRRTHYAAPIPRRSGDSPQPATLLASLHAANSPVGRPVRIFTLREPARNCSRERAGPRRGPHLRLAGELGCREPDAAALCRSRGSPRHAPGEGARPGNQRSSRPARRCFQCWEAARRHSYWESGPQELVGGRSAGVRASRQGVQGRR